MKNLILGALMLTGAVAFAQEPVKQTQSATTTTTTTTPANQSQPAQQPQKADARTAQPATERKIEAVKEEKTVTTEKKADPAKKS